MAIPKFLRFSQLRDEKDSTFLIAFSLGLLALNLWQGFLTEIHNDESYYWFYTKKLQWGYYDHPPMVALFEWLGQKLVMGNLSIRLIQILFFPVAIALFFVIGKSRKFLLMAILLFLASPFLNYLTFMVFPDGPLLIFFLLFLIFLEKQLRNPSNVHVLVLGMALSMMLYSKYHAILILPFLVLGNFQLLRRKWLYQVALLAFFLFLPHLIWQYQNDFASFQFHLSGRAKPISLKYMPDYIGQQLGAVGPILILAVFHKSRNEFEKHLKVLVISILGFFCFISLRGFVHIQWTSLAYFPALFLSAKFLEGSIYKRRFYFLLIPFILLSFLLRFQLVFPIFPGEKLGANFVKGQHAWADRVSDLTNGATYVYEHDLKEPSTYAFYSGLPAISFYPSARKSSQYAMWSVEDTIQYKPAIIGKKKAFEGSKLLEVGQRKLHYIKVDTFISYQNIQCEWVEQKGKDQVEIEVFNHRTSALPLSLDQPMFFLKEEKGERIELKMVSEWMDVGAKQTEVFSFMPKEKVRPGHYVICIADGRLSPSVNSDEFLVEY